MDLRNFFPVWIHCLVRISMVLQIDPCKDTYLSSNGVSQDYIPSAAGTCEIFWPNNRWNRRDIFVGFNTTQRCPAMSQCSPLYSLWMNGTLPVSNAYVSKQFCVTDDSGCCKDIITVQVRNCSPLRVYFHHNSAGCDRAICFVKGPDWDLTRPGNSVSTAEVTPINAGHETSLSGQTSSARLPMWSVFLISILIAAVICLILVTLLLWRNIRLKTNAIDGEAKNIIQVRNRRIAN